MKQAKVRKHTVGFFRNDAEVPFINLEMFETIEQATGIPHYWRDRNGNVSQFWHIQLDDPMSIPTFKKHRKSTFYVPGLEHVPGPNHGSMTHGSMTHGSMIHGSLIYGSLIHGSMNQGAMIHRSMTHGSMIHGSIVHRSMNRGFMNHGSLKHESMSHGSMINGSFNIDY